MQRVRHSFILMDRRSARLALSFGLALGACTTPDPTFLRGDSQEVVIDGVTAKVYVSGQRAQAIRTSWNADWRDPETAAKLALAIEQVTGCGDFSDVENEENTVVTVYLNCLQSAPAG